MRRGQASPARCDQQDLHLRELVGNSQCWLLTRSWVGMFSKLSLSPRRWAGLAIRQQKHLLFSFWSISQLSVCLVSHLLMIILSGGKHNLNIIWKVFVKFYFEIIMKWLDKILIFLKMQHQIINYFGSLAGSSGPPGVEVGLGSSKALLRAVSFRQFAWTLVSRSWAAVSMFATTLTLLLVLFSLVM